MTEEHETTSQSPPGAEAEPGQRKPWTEAEIRQIREMIRTLAIFLLLLIVTMMVVVAIQEWVF